ncbi:uncharacterized protein LOC131682432 [Topomyia yanbarensis]|uniref:uncharacterized protein LOC131682432 n=1 Tax=Topomyia yanbarensis TaxID=2498891 RepID=UPI00273CBCD0|nr:uncharacterized protein LOC131682432 [Topomyia yanbarensis]
MKLVTDASCEALEPVRIAIRERPSDIDPEDSIIQHHTANDQILIVDERPFAFDYVFRPEASQALVYDALIRPLVVKMINGFFCTALAYGQTGTGKTFTMGLQWDHSGPHDVNRGMITRALDHTFDLLSESRNKEDYEIEVSFVEIYNEKIYDLLSENSAEPVNTRGCKFNGGTKRSVSRANQAQDILIEGNKNRHVRPTKMNTLSSRSHAIFSIHASVVHDDAQIVSALHLVDLAGSEGVRRTGHQGMALAEGVHINQGLLSIGKVLQALSIGSKVVPYRDSILSSVLQDSLNLNSYLTLLACVSALPEDLSETLSTIRFAQGAKTLKNNPQINAITAELKAKERTRTPGKLYVPGALKPKNLNAKTPKSAAKRPHAPGGSSVKKVHSNTFCTPSKIRKLDYGKMNSTVAPVPVNKQPTAELLPPPPPPAAPVIVVPPTKAALQANDAASMMPPPLASNLPRFSDMLDKDFESIPADSRSSIFSLNLSSSTSVDQPVASSSAVSQSSSYSPIVKKCMETFEATIEQKLAQMFEKIQHFQPPIPATPTTNAPTITVDCSTQPDSSSAVKPTTSNDTGTGTSGAIPWDVIRREIQEAIRSEMSTINDSHVPKYESTPCQQPRSAVNEFRAAPTTAIRLTNPALLRLKEQAKCATAADDSAGETGLNSTVVANTKTPRHWEVINVDSEEEDAGAGDHDESGVIVRKRLSKRLSGSRQPFSDIVANVSHRMVPKKTVSVVTDESYLWEVQDGMVRRRSTRISLRKTVASHHQHRKGCCQSAKKKKPHFEALIEDEKENLEQTHIAAAAATMRKKAAPMQISNKVIAGYFQTPGGKKEPKMTAFKHGKAVLDLVNRGSIKEVQILPTVGLKMAYQIVTHRTINGKFKKIDDLGKLFIGGKKWSKFLEANYLS